MTFTDDDLRRLAESLYEGSGVNSLTITTRKGSASFDLRALLARLEAAEKVLSHGNVEECGWCECYEKTPVCCRCGKSEEDYDAWRQTAGK